MKLFESYSKKSGSHYAELVVGHMMFNSESKMFFCHAKRLGLVFYS